MSRFRPERREKRKQRYTKPSILIAAEGRHLTEKNYISGFNGYDARYNIYFVSSNETDPESLADNLRRWWNKDGYSEEYDDLKFIVIDLDNNRKKAEQLKN